jgi:hypothetical protein
MRCTEGDFHFIDLLGLHFEEDFSAVPETRGWLATLHRTTGLHLPSPMMYPAPLLQAATQHAYTLYPWLKHIAIPAWIQNQTWASFWAWADSVQRVVGTQENGYGTRMPLTAMAPSVIEELGPMTVIIDDPRDALRWFFGDEG